MLNRFSLGMGTAVSKIENMPDRHVAAEVIVDINEVVFESINGMLKDVQRPREEQSTIFRVSDEIRKPRREAYEPQIVSIGPFHRGDPKFLPTERIKRQFLLNLISRDPSNTLDRYIRAVSNPFFIAKVSSRYSEKVVGNDVGKSFVEMLVLDGCFIIEFMVRCFSRESMGELDFAVGNLSRLRNDLLMIENQIPFCVLEVLFDSSSIPGLFFENEPITLTDLAYGYLSVNIMSSEYQPIPEDVHHLLHLHHSAVRPTPPEDVQARPVRYRIMNTIKNRIIYSVFWVLSLFLTRRLPLKDLEDQWALSKPISKATELYQNGITFRPKRLAKCILDVTFSDIDGVMEIPLLTVSPTTVPQLSNLVAFEEHMPECGSVYSTYMGFMDCLIDTSADVELLVQSGVLSIDLGGPDEVAHFFNDVGNLAFLDHRRTYLSKLFKCVKQYSSNESNRLRARTMHDYFSSPWSALSVFAAILLLLLSILQTFFAVYAYIHPP